MNTQQPNFLIIVADQLAAQALPCYGHPHVHAPNLSALAAAGVVFENTYCNSPLCAPSRAALMTGQLPSHTGVYDNAAELPASMPTFAHYLRSVGYQTCLAGKMHFIGPDQLHGFETRLTTDIYPADFGWTPNWDEPDVRATWYHNMSSVAQAGPCITTNQLDFDEEVTFHAVRKLYNLVRSAEKRPFCLTVSLTHPHDPYAIAQEYWDRYDPSMIGPPNVAARPADQLDPHSRRLRWMCAMDEQPPTEAQVRNARHAYYAAISYVDDKVGELLHALQATGLDDNTIIIFTSDHGDMLGERGLWYKMSFFEWAARIPLIFHAPQRFAAHRVAQNVSLIDLLPTLVELANGAAVSEIDGHSLVALLHGDAHAWPDVALGEYLAEGVSAPCLMIRRANYKYIFNEFDPPQLYDLRADPDELHNLAGQAMVASVERQCEAELTQHWQPAALRQAIIASQRRRRLVDQALHSGQFQAWDFQPFQDAAQMYMRNHLDLNDLERRARYPLV